MAEHHKSSAQQMTPRRTAELPGQGAGLPGPRCEGALVAEPLPQHSGSCLLSPRSLAVTPPLTAAPATVCQWGSSQHVHIVTRERAHGVWGTRCHRVGEQQAETVA